MAHDGARRVPRERAVDGALSGSRHGSVPDGDGCADADVSETSAGASTGLWPSGRLLVGGCALLVVWGSVAGGMHAVSGAVWLGLLAVPLTVAAVTDLRSREIHDVTSLVAVWLLLAAAYQAAGWRHVGQVAVAVAVGSGLLGLAWLAGQCGAGDVGHGGITAGIAMLTWVDPLVARWAADDAALRLPAVLWQAASAVTAAVLMLAVFSAAERRQREDAVSAAGRPSGGPLAVMLGPAAYTLSLPPDPVLLTAAHWFG